MTGGFGVGEWAERVNENYRQAFPPGEDERERMTITEFLTARLDEDERDWRAIAAEWEVLLLAGRPVDPARVLADIAAKRAILEMHVPVPLGQVRGEGHVRASALVCGYDTDPDGVSESEMDYPCPTVLILAQPYADHPDFDPAWKM